MERSVIRVIVKLCAEAVVFAIVIGVAIGVIGYINHWNSSTTYSNAFFLAGCLVIIAGTSSRLAASEDVAMYHLDAKGFRGLSRTERSNFIVEVSSSMRLAILGLLSGILLLLIAAIAAYLL